MVEGHQGDFDVRVAERDGGRLRLSASGELDLATSPILLAQLQENAGDDVRHLELDLSAVSFIDSTGLGILVRAHNRITQLDGGQPLTIIGARPQARKVLEITGLTKVFRLVDDEPE